MKKALALLLAVCMLLSLAACGTKTEPAPAASAAPAQADSGETAAASALDSLAPVNLTFSTQASQDVEYVKAMYRVQEKIADRSGGKLTLTIHDNGSLMTQEGEIDACARGTLDMYFSSPFLISNQLDYLSMFTAAYI